MTGQVPRTAIDVEPVVAAVVARKLLLDLSIVSCVSWQEQIAQRAYEGLRLGHQRGDGRIRVLVVHQFGPLGLVGGQRLARALGRLGFGGGAHEQFGR